MPELTSNAIYIAAISTLVLGTLLCFFGYRLFLFFMALGGLLAGGIAAGIGGLLLSQDQTVALIAGILGGFIGAVFVVLLYFAILFSVGAVVAGALGYVVCLQTGTAFTFVSIMAIVVAAILGGVLALLLQRLVITVSSSMKGGVLLSLGIFYFIRRGTADPVIKGVYDAIAKTVTESGLRAALTTKPSLPENIELARLLDTSNLYLLALGAIAFMLAGITVQYTVTARPPKAAQEKKPEAKPAA